MCGSGQPFDEPDLEVVRRPGGRDPWGYALRVKGDALYPRFWDGDLIEVATTASVHDGDLAVIVQPDGRRWIGRVSIQERKRVVRCEPVNPSEDPIDLPLAEVELQKVICVKPTGSDRPR